MFSSIVMDHVTRPRNCGPLEGATHKGVAGSPGDGPYMVLEFTVDGERISRAAYMTFGCPAAMASGSMIAELAVGRSICLINSVTPQDLLRLLGGLPEGKEACCELAVRAVRAAFAQE